MLKWTTASELRNNHFVVESSTDGIAFQRLGQVARTGTSSQAHSYQFADKNLARYAVAQVYYRQQQVDMDGTTTYSPVRAVQVPAAEGLAVVAYPNPSANSQGVTVSLHTNHAGPAELLLTDMYLLRVRQSQQQTLKLVRQ